MHIEKAQKQQLAEIRQVFEAAKAYMRAEGNLYQWVDGYPSEELLLEDMAHQYLYVIVDEDQRIQGCFAFILGQDPTYQEIDGAWRSDTPYGTIHRIASRGEKKGILSETLQFCRQQIDHVRIDTHADNQTMQAAVLKEGFQYCGIIYLANGDPRLAYDWIQKLDR